MRDELRRLLDAAEAGEAGSMLRVMGKQANPRVAQDIPVASEMLGLLRHFGNSLPYQETDCDWLPLQPGIYDHATAGRTVAIVPVKAGELDLIAYWLTQNIQSPELLALPGLLAIPFSIEEHDGQSWLIPEWFSLFYVDASADHCVPLLGLRSVLDDGRFSDWVPAALARADAFGLPTAAAVQGAGRVVVKKSTPA